MAEEETYRVEIGEHGILGAGAHLSVRFVDNDGNRIVEINGLATRPGHDPTPTGSALTGHDIIGYIWDENDPRTFFGHPRTRSVDTLAERPLSGLQDDLRVIRAVVDEINAQGISYQVLNTNSNSVAMTTLRALGYTVEDVRAITGRLTPGINIDLLTDAELEAIRNDILDSRGLDSSLRPVARPEHCFLHDTRIQMWPLDPSIKPRADGSYDEELVQSKVWYKQQDQIAVGDVVVSYDKLGRMQPGDVTRTMTNIATHILDFWGTGVTPGHAYNCADGPLKGDHAPLMDILRMDGALTRIDGTTYRAATNCDVGTIGDRMIHAEATMQKPDGSWTPKKRGQIRFGTRISTPDGKKSISVMEIAERQGWSLSDDGYMVGKIEVADGTVQEGKFPFPYTHGAELPKPEDYILTRSQVTLEDIYLANEWEQIGTRMPAPDSLSGFNPNSTMKRTKPKPNIPPAFADRPDAPTAKNRAQRPAHASASPSAPGMNRKQRKAIEAKQRKAAKMRRRAAG